MIGRLTPAIAGFVFGMGLWLSGMTDPGKVLGFLDVAGRWDPTLAFVLAGAVGVTFVAFRFVLARARPVIAEAFDIPTRRRIDRELVLGSALFGIGWGIAGYCPGPAITSLARADVGLVVFVLAMIVGGFVYGPARRTE